jgi:HSP20 family protein
MFTPSLWRIRKFSEAVPELIKLQRDMNRFFSYAGPRTEQDFPGVDIWEDPDTVFVTAEIPGFDPDKFDVSVTGDILTLAGTAQKEILKDGETYLRQ